MKKKTRMRRTQICLPDNLLDKLSAEAKRGGVSRSEIVRRILTQHFQEVEK